MKTNTIKNFKSPKIRMVYVSDSLAESCSKMQETLGELQPRLCMTSLCCSASEWLQSLYPTKKKSIQRVLISVEEATKECSICKLSFSNSKDVKQSIVFFSVDYDDLAVSPECMKVCRCSQTDGNPCRSCVPTAERCQA